MVIHIYNIYIYIKVSDSRRNHDCEPALQWCNENKPQLRRIER